MAITLTIIGLDKEGEGLAGGWTGRRRWSVGPWSRRLLADGLAERDEPALFTLLYSQLEVQGL